MAITATKVKGIDAGDAEIIIADIVGPASYTAGGEAAQPIKDLMRIGSLDTVVGAGGVAAGGYVLEYDPAADTLLYFLAGTADAVLEEVTAVVDLSGVTIRATCIGR